jgi:hypothetical protein
MLGFTPQGVPRVTLEAKLAGFSHCVQDGSWEDALGHLFDLMHYLCPSMVVQLKESGEHQVFGVQPIAYGTAAYFGLLHSMYGRNPIQMRISNGQEEVHEVQLPEGEADN